MLLLFYKSKCEKLMTRIDKAIDNLLVKSEGEIKSRIEEISFDIGIDNTKAKAHCYCLKIDGNGHVRIRDLVDYIDEKIVEYAIPKREIDEAGEYYNRTGSFSKVQKLRKKAIKLFTDLEKTGEGGEILLYILIQEFLKLPQLISKMSLKTSGRLHYQGADGIHVKYDNDSNNLNLYWAEAKMYKDLNDAISECFKSLHGFLLEPYGYGSTQERDIHLITSNIQDNINNPELEDLLVRYFDLDDDLSNNIIYKGICFIGFDCNKYPSNEDLSQTTASLKAIIETEHLKWHKRLGANIQKHANLESKEIHVFLMPFPSVEEFRKYYLDTIQQ